MELFRIGFITFSLIDLIDIFAVTIVFYQIFRIMRGTRATQMFAGLLLLLGAGSLAQLFGMNGMAWLIQSVGAVWVIAFVILFQPELRRMLIRIGQLGLLRSLFKASGEQVLGEVAGAMMELSRHRFGGLVVFQRTTGMRGVIETGISLQAEVSWELLVTIFHPRTPLHDMAVIISGETVVAARCQLPLSTNPGLNSSLGTRHRAALGITEEVDAVAVVVSEETGTVSVACNGQFTLREADESSLKAELTRLLYPSVGRTEKGRAKLKTPASPSGAKRAEIEAAG